MSASNDNARRLAEDAFAYTPIGPRSEREEREQYVLLHGPNAHHLYGLALRLRADDDVETIADEVRAWFAERGRTEFTWLVGDSSTPADLRDRLLRLGAQPDADEPVYSGMVLAEPPPGVEGIEAREVETFEEYAAVRELGWDLLGMSDEERAEPRARLRVAWDVYQGHRHLQLRCLRRRPGGRRRGRPVHTVRRVPRRRQHAS
jgi:hypothetical protein